MQRTKNRRTAYLLSKQKTTVCISNCREGLGCNLGFGMSPIAHRGIACFPTITYYKPSCLIYYKFFWSFSCCLCAVGSIAIRFIVRFTTSTIVFIPGVSSIIIGEFSYAIRISLIKFDKRITVQIIFNMSIILKLTIGLTNTLK